MDIKEIRKFISNEGIKCELKDFFFDSENILYFYVGADKVTPLFISKSKVKAFENKIKNKFGLKDFNIILPKKESKFDLTEVFKKHHTKQEDFKIFYIADDSIKIYLNRTLQYLKEIKRDIKNALNNENIKWEVIEIKNIEEAYKSPSKLAILRVIKKSAPAGMNTIKSVLMEKNFLFQENLLKNKLDEMRKKDMIVHINGKYALTSKSLSMLPITKDKYSSDIERALELGRKKW